MSSYTKQQLADILEPVGQIHLLKYWDELSANERHLLGEQISGIDWPKTLAWVDSVLGTTTVDLPFDRLSPAPYVPLKPVTQESADYMQLCRETGRALLKSGKVGGFTVAGGQGTRLGYDGPKGTYCFTEIHHKSLFQFFAESICKAQEKYQTPLPWYIMTSPANNQATIEFFEKNAFFGLDAANVMFFIQGTLPAFDFNGKALLESKCSLALSANGHGGSFAALHDSGALADMKRRGVSIISYWQVDNPLGYLFDPLFIGMHHLKGSEMSSRALIKRDAMEKLGHFCLLDGKTIIVEYSDMPNDLLQKTDADGRLTYRAGSPAIHVLQRDFIERLTNGTLNLRPHRANKKITCLDDTGTPVKPDKPNAIKLEFFLFDALPMAKTPLILEGDRKEIFSPIKNADGNDSPETCRQALHERTVRWLAAQGVNVPPSVRIELSPRLAVEPDDVKDILQNLPTSISEDSELDIC